MGELISVIINVYNGEKYIKKCLDSIINQTYKNLEILIINDGSTDETFKICESYKDDRIRIINQENMGLSKARNVGIENAKGEYFYFIDVDDWIELDTIEYLYDLCKKNNTLISTCKAVKVFDYNITKSNEKEKIEVLSQTQMLAKILVSKDADVAIWNKLIHKELFKEIRFENRIANDVVVSYKLVLATEKISYSNQKKYYYLQHVSSITYNNNPNRAIDLYKATLERYYYIKNIYPDLIENDIGTIYRIIFTFFNKDEKVQKFLKEEQAVKLVRKMFSFKILKTKIAAKTKIKILLFVISPQLCKYIDKKYHNKNNQYKM